MYLVGVHAQVSDVAPPLLDRTLNTLVESLAEEALLCFKQVKRFGMGGMLRVGFSLFFRHGSLDHKGRLMLIDRADPAGYPGDRVHAPNSLALRHDQHGENTLGPLH